MDLKAVKTVRRINSAIRPLIETLEGRQLMSTTPVLNLNDSGTGSLREAVLNAAPGETLDMSALSGGLVLTGSINIDKDLTIIGPGSNNLTISSDNQSGRAFTVYTDDINLSLSGFKIQNAGNTSIYGGAIYFDGVNGNDADSSLTLEDVDLVGNTASNYGGAIYMTHGVLKMTDCDVRQNATSGDGLASGGGVYLASGTLELERVTFEANQVTATAVDTGMVEDTGDASGGGLWADLITSTSLVNCTFAGNQVVMNSGPWGSSSASASGGAARIVAQGDATLQHLTVVNNQVTGDANAYSSSFADTGGILLIVSGTRDIGVYNSLMAGNTVGLAGTTPDSVDLAVRGGSGGRDIKYNVLGNGDYLFGVGNGTNLYGSTANPLAAQTLSINDNGGPTRTVGLDPTSPAIDAGHSVFDTTIADQRGTARSGRPDAGAFEVASVVNLAPAITSSPVTNGLQNHVYSYTVTGVDPEAAGVSFSAVGLPSGLSFTDNHNGTATLTGLPIYGGVYNVTLTASDGVLTTDQAFVLNIAPDAEPDVPYVPAMFATAGAAFSHTIVGSDGDGDILDWDAMGVMLPTWATLVDNGDNTATITGTPAAGDVGVFNGHLVPTDGSYGTYVALTFVVSPATPPNSAPVFTSLNLPGGKRNHAYSATISAADFDNDNVNFTYTGTLPSGLTFTDNGDGSATIAGTPVVATTLDFTVHVSDSTDSTAQAFGLVISPDEAPAAVAIASAVATVGTPFSYTVHLFDNDADAISFATIGRPAWMTVTDNHDGSATLTGMPTADSVGQGIVQLTASDGYNTTPVNIPLTTSAAPQPAVASASIQNGKLTVYGSDNADTIQVFHPKNKRGFVRAIVNNRTWNFAQGLITNGMEIYARGGNDTVTANYNNGNYVYGGSGNDTIFGNDAADILSGGLGNDKILGFGGDDLLNGYGGNDKLYGGAGNDRLYGYQNNDQLWGDAGADLFDGGEDADTYYARDGVIDSLIGDGEDSAQIDSADARTGLMALLA